MTLQPTIMNTQNNSSTTTTSEIIKKTLHDEDQTESLGRQSSLKKDDFVVESDYKQAKTLPEVDAFKMTSPTHQKDDELTMAVAVAEESGRDRLKRHRVEMAGRVWIPDIWGQEDLLKDWIDCNAFDASLGNNRIMSARAALVQERTAASSSVLRIENSDES